MGPETAFIEWLSTRKALAGRLVPLLPPEVFSEQGRVLISSILTGTFVSQSNGTPVQDNEAIAFLQTQLLALLGRDAARAQIRHDPSLALRTADLLRLLGDILDDLPLVSFDEIIPEPREFLPTGIESLDEQISGLAKEELGIVALSPGRGKTHLLINFAANALFRGQAVHYITVADAGVHELVPRLDACLLERPAHTPGVSAKELQTFHAEALERIAGTPLWISDFTDRECTLSAIEHVIGECQSDLVIVDHADDIVPPFGDPTATRHSLRLVYKSIKQLSVKYHVPVWTASQTPEQAWFMESAGISELAEAKTGKASGAAVVLVFSGGPSPVPGIVYCTIAKARRRFSRRTFPLHFDYARVQTW